MEKKRRAANEPTTSETEATQKPLTGSQRARLDRAQFEKGPPHGHQASCETTIPFFFDSFIPTTTTGDQHLLLDCSPCTFDDWQQVLGLQAASKTKAEREARVRESEADPSWQHTDKRRRVSPGALDHPTRTAVPVQSSNGSRTYRRQQESSGSCSGDNSETSVEPKWSDNSDDEMTPPTAISAYDETESVLSQQMDYVALARTTSNYEDERSHSCSKRSSRGRSPLRC